MKFFKYSLFFLLYIVLTFSVKTVAQPKVIVDQVNYNFGDIVQDSVVQKTFTITNGGNDTLKITNIKTSCGCTAAVLGNKEIPASKSTQIKVTFNSSGKLDKQIKNITLNTNDPKNSIIVFTLTGNVLKK